MSKKKIKSKIVPDHLHYHEAIDRIYLIGRMAEDFVIEHPVCMRHKKVKKRIEKALKHMAIAYQMVGGIDANKFDQTKKSDKQ